MADDVPAGRRTSGPAAAARAAIAAAKRVPGALIAATAAFIGASALQSATLAYFAALLVSAVPVTRAAWPERVDRDLRRHDAALRRWARLACAGLAAAAARADLPAHARRLRDAARGNAAYDRADEGALRAHAAVADRFGVSKRWAEATWLEHRDAARAAVFVLRLAGAVAYTAATALVSLVYDEARARAPAVLTHLRGVIRKKMRSKEGAAAVSFPSSGSIKYRHFAHLVKWAVFLWICADIALDANALTLGSSFPIILPCVLTLALTGVMLEQWVFQHHGFSNATRAGGGTTAEHKALTELWSFLWSMMVTAYFVDAFLLRFTLGHRTLEVAFLALCQVKVINLGKEVQRAAPEDGHLGGAGKWRRGSVAVLAACVAKAAVAGAVVGVQMAALSLASLCVMTVVLLIREESLLSELDDSVGGVNGGEEGAGDNLAGNVARGGADEVCSERSSTIAEDASALEGHDDSSEEHVQEQRDEEPDCSSMDSWEFVEAADDQS